MSSTKLTIRRECNESGDIEHNHIDCLACGKSNQPVSFPKGYLDLDENEVKLITCRGCHTQFKLVSGTWYQAGGAEVTQLSEGSGC